jgi:prepilin peptidase dependent protein B
MKKQTGLTLIEIMIALLIGLIIIAATINIYITTIKGSSDTLRSARLNHDLESAMSLMFNDIRRAGYWGGAIAGADSRNNPFTTTTTTVTNFAPSNITVVNFTDSGGTLHTRGCILYSYDADADGHYDDNDDGVFDSPGDDTNEFYGFRVDNSSIQMRKTGTTTAACADGEWETMNIDTGNSRSEKVEIDSLTFDFDDPDPLDAIVIPPSKCKNVTTGISENMSCATTTLVLTTGEIVETRQVTITLSGHITGETSVSKTLTSTVKVRNDRVFTQP